jgi:hypothetical protein
MLWLWAVSQVQGVLFCMIFMTLLVLNIQLQQDVCLAVQAMKV